MYTVGGIHTVYVVVLFSDWPLAQPDAICLT